MVSFRGKFHFDNFSNFTLLSLIEFLEYQNVIGNYNSLSRKKPFLIAHIVIWKSFDFILYYITSILYYILLLIFKLISEGNYSLLHDMCLTTAMTILCRVQSSFTVALKMINTWKILHAFPMMPRIMSTLTFWHLTQ